MRVLTVLVAAALAAVALAAPTHFTQAHLHKQPSTNKIEMDFDEFKVAFGKAYASVEEHAKRAAIFAENLAFVRKHNAEGHTYTVGINQFSDLTNAEFKALYVSTPMPVRGDRVETLLSTASVPDSVDWRTQNAVSPVKNQGQCGSCWSFSSSGAIEGAWAIASGKLAVLSEQQLIDCSTSFGNNGCNGGLMDDAFKYVVKNGGLDTEADYPYTARDGTCNKQKAATHAATITGYKDVPHSNAAQMEAALALGPVAVAIEADQQAFQAYHSGIFSGTCGTQLDHGVLAVGYTQDYWIVKNSWGTTWGEAGYILLSRSVGGAAGQCGILLSASYPTSAGTLGEVNNTNLVF